MTITEWTPEEIKIARTRAEMAAMVDVITFLSALDELERTRNIVNRLHERL